jgi:cyanophycinase
MEHFTPKEKLVAVGGGESSDVTNDSLKIIEKFIELAGGAAKAEIVVLTVATDSPKDAEKRYAKIFKELEFERFDTVDVSAREEAFDEAVLEKIEKASGLYFTGGDQLHVTALVGGSPLYDLILQKFTDGCVVGGTSAGAMMMSSSMIVTGAADSAPKLGAPEIAPGLQLLPNAIIDTHFSQRGRHGRLLSAVAHNPQIVGFGIDERTAMIVEGEEFSVVGEGAVTVVCAKHSTHTNLPYLDSRGVIGIFGVDFHLLPEGYRYDLKKREPVARAFKEIKAAAAVNEE